MAHSNHCQALLNHFVKLTGKLGVLLAEEKVEGPAVTLTFGGIEVNTYLALSRLTQDKLEDLKAMITFRLNGRPPWVN